ncbi:NAD(P)/FAD-dependent oxidoreductase, partial [Chelatococcus asaccharovorans]
MAKEHIVVVGGGHAGFQAVTTLRAAGFEGSITLIDQDKYYPYQRPPLSKAFLTDALPPEKLQFRTPDFYSRKEISLRLGEVVVRVDALGHRLHLGSGETLSYDQLLLATGSHPRTLSVNGRSLEGVLELRNLSHAVDLATRMQGMKRITIVGGGYVGLEVAAAAIKRGCHVMVVEREPRILARVSSEPISQYMQSIHEANGVEFRLGEQVIAFVGSQKLEGVSLSSGEIIPADVALIGVGVVACDQLARQAGLTCHNGIVVDEFGRTSAPDIFAAGDVALHPAMNGEMMRLECIQNANDQSEAVVNAMLGATDKPYRAIPYFWSDQFTSKLHSAGFLNPDSKGLIRGEPARDSFSILHRDKGGSLCGIETVNAQRDCRAAISLIRDCMAVDFDLAKNAQIPLSACVAIQT